MNIPRLLSRAAIGTFLLAQGAFAAPLLFSVQTAGQVAQNLPYAQAPVTSGIAGLDTSLGGVLHDSWTSIGSDSGGILYNIEWQFSSTKSLAQRFIDAVAGGEAVTWTVTGPSIIGSQIMSGIWFFSDGAGDMASRFAGGTGNFADDDGFWGAGVGVINANQGFTGVDNITPSARWGFGNSDGSDSTYNVGSSFDQVLVLNGTFNATASIPAGFQNQVFVNTLDVPELNPVSASLPLMFAFISLAISGSRRKRA